MMQALKSDGKDHLVQAYDIRTSETGGKSRMSLRLSDGCHYVRAVSAHLPDLKNFDIVNVLSYKVTEVKSNSVMIVDKAVRAYTGISGLIGSPVEYRNENPNAGTIVTAIPSSAKHLQAAASPSPVHASAGNGKASPAAAPVAAPAKASPVPQPPPKPASASRKMSGEGKAVKPIKALGLYSTDWTIKVRLIKRGEQRKFTREKLGESALLPLEFIDEEGTQISATVFGAGIEKYLAILEPMKCFFVSNGNVKLSNKKYTSIKTDYSLTLDAATKIEEAPEDPQIPRSGYSFTPIAKIAELPAGVVIDVLGVVRAVGDVVPIPRRDGTQTTKKVLTVCDDSGHAVDLTLWGPFAEGDYRVDDILALRCVKVSEYNGKQLNTMNDSGIVKEPEDPHVAALREWY